MGDPLGIGAEVIVKALADRSLRGLASWRIYGVGERLEEAARSAGLAWPFDGEGSPAEGARAGAVVLIEPDRAVWSQGSVAGRPRATAESGLASMWFLERAIADCKREPGDPMRADALVTGPISKEAWSLAGFGRYPGHTELLAESFGAGRVRMMFEAPGLRTILVTTHIPLARVPETLTAERVLETILAGSEACVCLGVERPRIAVCGLNPHAGEGGLFGDEEPRAIVPAIERARAMGLAVSGPHPGDTVFTAARAGKHDLVVAMYHDQGLIPVKLLAFDRAVNVTVGLPIVRTSPDHGTAYDIARTNRADPGSMKAAIELAIRMCGRRH